MGQPQSQSSWEEGSSPQRRLASRSLRKGFTWRKELPRILNHISQHVRKHFHPGLPLSHQRMLPSNWEIKKKIFISSQRALSFLSMWVDTCIWLPKEM